MTDESMRKKRDLVNDTFTDAFEAFDHAAAATRLGWPVVFVGRSDTYGWMVWVSYPTELGPDGAREALEHEKRTEENRRTKAALERLEGR